MLAATPLRAAVSSPFVLLVCLVALLAPSAASAATITSTAVGDAHVSEAAPTTAFTAATTMRVEGGVDPDFIGYARFDLAGISGAVTKVVLRYNVTDISADPVKVHRVPTWVAGMTWNTRPAYDATALATTPANMTTGWKEIALPVTVGNGEFSLALVATGADATEISTKEGAGAPQLVVTTETTTTPDPDPDPDPEPQPSTPATYGAQLPVSYSLAAVTGTKYFVATNGNNANAGTAEAAPLQTLAAAIAKVGSGASATIVVRGGTYRGEGQLAIPAGRTIRVVAYPGEVPVFDGSQEFATGWVTEGALRYHAYTAQPVTNGSGVNFTGNQNLTGTTGKQPDQAWVGATPLRQVAAKSSVVAGTFYVESGRIYLHGTDVAKGGVAASNRDRFLKVSSPGTTLEGIRIQRYSNSADDYGVILVESAADDFTLRDVEIVDTPFQAVHLAGGSTLATILDRPTFDRVTIDRANWQGIASTYVNDLTVKGSRIVNVDPWDEFTSSPVSGAVKTSKNWRVKVVGSEIANNKSHGLWFDQSNYDVDVANNRITGNTGNGVFFEISDDLLMVNNYVQSSSSAAIKLAGSSGIKLVNNTFVGGSDAIGVYTDSRSKAGCSNPANAVCTGGLSSDRDTVRTRPATMDWMPRIDLMLDNVVANPTSAGYCGLTAMCITLANAGASAPIQTIIHKADAARGIPQSRIDGNVYVNGSSGALVRTSAAAYTTVGAFTSAMAASPVGIAGIDATSKAGTSWVTATGQPTAALTAANGQAVAVPVDAGLNQYIAAGTKRYGFAF